MHYPLENNILYVLRQCQRDYGRGVLPREVQARLGVSISEFSVRRYMLRLWRRGELVRVGGARCRQGYRLPTVIERVGFRVTGGVWPWGTETAQVA